MATSCVVVIFSASNVSAITDAQRKALDSGVLYFNTEDTGVCVSGGFSSISSGGSNLDYAGRPVLTQGQLQAISQNASTYQQAAQQVDIPWQMLAVIHLRESGLKVENPANGQGIYQFFDKHGGPYPTGPVDSTEFLRQTILAAQFIKAKASSNYTNDQNLTAQTTDPNTIKDTFFSYNGRANVYQQQAASLGYSANSQGFEGSPYVMNKADAARDPDALGAGEQTWGQIKVDNGGIQYPANSDYGAFVEYAALTGLPTTGGCNTSANCTGVNNAAAGLSATRQSIVCLAQQELSLWQSGQLKPGTDYFKYENGKTPGDWCAWFTSWVYAQAGDPLSSTNGGSEPLVTGILSDGKNNPNFHYHDVNGYTPQPGDIAIHLPVDNSEQHVNIVVGVSGNNIILIGGNQGGQGSDAAWYSSSSVTVYTTSSATADKITGYVSPD